MCANFSFPFPFSLSLSFSLLLSVWFDNSQVGMMAGFIFWFLTLLPHLFIAGYYTELNT